MVTIQLRLAGIAVSMVLLAAPAQVTRTVHGSEISEPVAVLSIASVDRLMSDIGYLTQTAGRADVGGLIQMVSSSFLEDLDPNQPAGVLIVMENGEPKGVGFLPIPDLSAALAKIEKRFAAEVEQYGNGVQRLAMGQGIFIKQQGNWVFFSDEARHLNQLPSDPAKLLDGLNTTYDLSARIFVQHVPLPLRQFAVAKLKAAAQSELQAEAASQDSLEREFAEQTQQHTLAAIEHLFQETDQITLGWTIDGPGRKMFLELSTVAIADSKFAQQLSRLADAQSSQMGFMLPDATATLLAAGSFSDEQVRHLLAMLDIVRRKLTSQMQADPNTPPQLEKIFAQFADVVEQSVRTGRFDLGSAVVLAPQSFAFVGGGRIAEGRQLAEAFQQLVELARNEPGVPDVQFNADRHQGVDFHTFSVPIDDEEDDSARRALGDTLPVVIGTGQESLYLAFGANCTDLLKRVLDASAEKGTTPVPPLDFRVATKPLLDFLASVDDDPKLSQLAETLEQASDTDEVSITITPTTNGFTCRIEIEEAVLKMLGRASREE
jgi:hypothetical protein